MRHAYVGKLLRLTLLAPDLVAAVLDGRLPKAVRLEDLVRPLPADWPRNGGRCSAAGSCSRTPSAFVRAGASEAA